MNRLTCAQAKRIYLVDYLASIGILPQKVRGDNYWYLSPFRDEKQPSFKVARTKNIWYDHGMGIGGDLLRFGVLFHQCPLREFLDKLSRKKSPTFSFHQPFSDVKKDNLQAENKLQILSVTSLSNATLLDYIKERRISFLLAEKYLEEVQFQIGEKNYQTLGFKNMKGGYELRSKNFKGSSSPKDITLIQKGGDTIAVFEGFFSFLSYLEFQINNHENFLQKAKEVGNFLILNSLSFIDKIKKISDDYRSTHLYLDRDQAGKAATQKMLKQLKNCEDKSTLYEGHKDLNDYLVHQMKMKQELKKVVAPKQRINKGRRI